MRSVAYQPAGRERVELIVAQLDKLPTLPAVAARLLAVTTSEESSARDVSAIIESDAAATAAILRMVRRADLGAPTRAITVAQAVTLLGFNRIRNSILSLQLCETLPAAEGDPRAQAVGQDLWKHSIAVACAADLMAAELGNGTAPGEAFVCGLLHDIGKIALSACLPKSYARVVDQVERQRICICDVERAMFGLDHTIAGKRLATRWRLPVPVIECIWLHQQPPEALPSSVAQPRLIEIVHLANLLVRQLRIGFSGYVTAGEVAPAAARLGLDSSKMDDIAERVPKQMAPFCELIGIDQEVEAGLQAESLVATNKELGIVNARLTDANRRLETRSACFEAINRFSKQLTPRDSVASVCLAAAASIRALVSTSHAVAFAGTSASRCIYIGCAGPHEGQGSTEVVEPGDPDLAGDLRGQRMMRAPESCEAIWRCSGQEEDRRPLWMLPMHCSDAEFGGILFLAEQDSLDWLLSAAEACDALSTTIGLAVSSALQRAQAERMSEELVDLHRRLSATQSDRVRDRSLSMIAEMAAGAAHELNNPLSVISGRAQMELSQCGDSGLARALQVIVEQAHRASQIVTDLMGFAKPQPPHPSAQRLADVLEALCQHWRGASTDLPAQQKPSMSVSITDAEAEVYADPEQLNEILNAVMANAVEACRGDSAKVQVNSPSAVSEETIRIVIADNGVGMRHDVLEHAVDPFFSSRPAGRSRGLGLSRAVRLVEINSGRLWLESTPDVGTTVTIELPGKPQNAETSKHRNIEKTEE